MIDNEIKKKADVIIKALASVEAIKDEDFETLRIYNEMIESHRVLVNEALEMIAEKIDTLGLTLAQIKSHPRLTSWEREQVKAVEDPAKKPVKKRNTNNPKKGLLLFLIQPNNSTGAGVKIYKNLKVDSIKQENLSKKLIDTIKEKGDLNKNLMKYVHSEEAKSYLETSEGQTFFYNLVNKLKSIRKSIESVDSEKTA